MVKIPDGHYKATLYGKDTAKKNELESVKAKSKVFKVECQSETTIANPGAPTNNGGHNGNGSNTDGTTQGNSGNGGTNSSVPGNNGTLKVHEIGTPSGTENNDPKVCAFNLEGFGFDRGQSGYLKFSTQGNDAPVGTAPEAIYSFGPTNAEGYAISRDFNNGRSTINIPNGHYKVTLYGKDTAGNMNLADVKAKSKVFKVECAASAPGSTTPTTPTPPSQGGSGSVLGATTSTAPTIAKSGSLQNTGSQVILSTLLSLVIVTMAWTISRKKSVSGMTQEAIDLIAL